MVLGGSNRLPRTTLRVEKLPGINVGLTDVIFTLPLASLLVWWQDTCSSNAKVVVQITEDFKSLVGSACYTSV